MKVEFECPKEIRFNVNISLQIEFSLQHVGICPEFK